MTDQAPLRQLTKLLHPFPSSVVQKNPSGGGMYVKHSTVEERLLDVLGSYDFELVEVIRGDVDAVPPNPQGNSKGAKEGKPARVGCVVGVVARLRVVIDGVPVTVEEAGDCESPQNWPHDGARMKDAMSDAFKRAAMRLGVGLHLWSQDNFYLGAKLLKQDQETYAKREAGRGVPADEPAAVPL